MVWGISEFVLLGNLGENSLHNMGFKIKDCGGK